MRRLVLAAMAIFCVLPAKATEFNPQLDGLVSGYIRPATTRFSEAAAALPGAVETVCQETGRAAADGFRSAFSDTVLAFSGVHFLRFGPLIDNDRVSRLAFMPDPRGITQRQLRKIRAGKDTGVLSAARLADKSVAVQGLTALELIAFSKSSEVVLGRDAADKAFTCGYALAIAVNVAKIAEELADDWADPDGYSTVLLSAGPDNDRFRTSREALESMFNTVVTGLIIARDQDLLPALGSSQEGAKPHRFPFSRSANSIVFLSGELTGLQETLGSFNLEALTPEEFAWIFDSISYEFGNARSILEDLTPPLRQTFGEGDSYARVKVLAITLQSLRDTIALELAGALDLAGGFNALDGD
ncbi:imelysin family protein [Roseibium sp. AS2]|uniref:imelysin family protein n=1 Tax=Roseibium sp. AS2 TaxID=3135781 RepID=UPI003175A1A1